MYSKNQEKIVFDIVLLLLVGFQIATIVEVKYASDSVGQSLIFLGFNILFLGLMIPYAKWVWKLLSYQEAFFTVVKREAVVFGLILLVIGAVSLLDIVKNHA